MFPAQLFLIILSDPTNDYQSAHHQLQPRPDRNPSLAGPFVSGALTDLLAICSWPIIDANSVKESSLNRLSLAFSIFLLSLNICPSVLLLLLPRLILVLVLVQTNPRERITHHVDMPAIATCFFWAEDSQLPTTQTNTANKRCVALA